jgi:dipeptidyl-peptidase-4
MVTKQIKQVLLTCVGLLGLVNAQGSGTLNSNLQSANPREKLTLQDIWERYLFSPQALSGFNALNNGKEYSVLSGDSIVIFGFDSEKPLRSYGFSLNGKNLNIQDFSFSSDQSKVIFATQLSRIYRHSEKGIYYVADIGGASPEILSTKEIMYPEISPNNEHVAFVEENNLFLYHLTSKKRIRITDDGKKNEIIHGASDWVYEEEFETTQAFSWSPNGRYLAWLKFDETEVPAFSMDVFKGQLYPSQTTFKYPKVGEPNSKVSVWIYDTQEKNKIQIEIPDLYEYIPRIKWAGSRLMIMALNRLQNDLRIYVLETESDKKTVPKLLYKEISEQYVDLPDAFEPISGTPWVIITSEKEGFRHLYLLDLNNGKVRPITSGNWEVTDYHGFHPGTQKIFFTSTETGSTERQLFSTDLKGKKTQLTQGKGTHTIQLSGDYYTDTYSSLGEPYVITLHTLSGNKVRTLKSFPHLVNRYQAWGLRKPELLEIPASDGTLMNAWYLPPYTEIPTEGAPLLMFVYGGPGSQNVKNAWLGANYGWFQYLAMQGFAVACVDNRGTGAKGKAFRQITYGRLGKIETEDQITAAQFWGAKSEINAARIGIFGWSYGGYMSSLCLLKGKGIFKTAIAVAPVTNWKYYDSIYTERYMGTLKSNPDGFDAQSPISIAGQLNGNYLLIHGTGDDNVHWQNSAEMVNALVSQNKQFNLFVYPDRDHGIYGGKTRMHLYQMLTDYLQKNL